MTLASSTTQIKPIISVKKLFKLKLELQQYPFTKPLLMRKIQPQAANLGYPLAVLLMFNFVHVGRGITQCTSVT